MVLWWTSCTFQPKHFILAPVPIWSCHIGRANAWWGELFQATCSWLRLLCCCSHREGFPSSSAGQAGGAETTSKVSWLFSEEAAAKEPRIKQDWKHLATKQGPVWSSASRNFRSRSERKTQSWRFEFTGEKPPVPVLWHRHLDRKVCIALAKPIWRFCWRYQGKSYFLHLSPRGQWSTGNPYGSRAAATVFWTGLRQPERFCLPVLEENLLALLMLDHIFSHCKSV